MAKKKLSTVKDEKIKTFIDMIAPSIIKINYYKANYLSDYLI